MLLDGWHETLAKQELVKGTLESVCNYFASATSNMCCNNLITPMWCRFVGNEWLCNIRCVVWNYYDLGLLQVGLKSFMISVDYRDYMGSSFGNLIACRSFRHLNSYSLVGSVTPMVLLGKRLKWKLGLVYLEIVQILMQDRCLICMEHTICSDIYFGRTRWNS